VALLLCALSGYIVTGQALFGMKTVLIWRRIHLITTLVVVGAVLPHVVFSFARARRNGPVIGATGFFVRVIAVNLSGVLVLMALGAAFSGRHYVNEFPKDYSFLFGKNRPFAPSLARTDTGKAFDVRSLAGSESCGTAGCHSQILQEWKPSAHRYAAMDTVFQGIQTVMAKQNGAESTRYCGGGPEPLFFFFCATKKFRAHFYGGAGSLVSDT